MLLFIVKSSLQCATEILTNLSNLYGWAMSQPLPTDGFQWMSKEEINICRKIPCILEVDLFDE